MRQQDDIFIYCLIFPNADRRGYTIVRGSECDTLVDAQTLHADRVANGEAFPDEHATLIDVAQYDEANK